MIADPGGAYLSRFGDDDSLILNPFDDRDAGWSPFAEIEWVYDCQRLAKATSPMWKAKRSSGTFTLKRYLRRGLRTLWEERRQGRR